MPVGKTITFEVTPKHLALLRAAVVRWEDCEFGAPAIDCKRPYGNSSVLLDMVEVLGLVLPLDPYDQPVISRDMENYLRQLHAETETVLQIALDTGEFREGRYVKSEYADKWRAVVAT